MPLYRVCVLQSREGRFYVGLSDDIEKRRPLDEDVRGPWTLAWQSANLSLGDARKLENRLKRQGRGKGFYSITGLPRNGPQSGSCRTAGSNPVHATKSLAAPTRLRKVHALSSRTKNPA